MELGAKLVLKTVEAIAADEVVALPQDESKAMHHAPKNLQRNRRNQLDEFC